jgi:hypothetical protein
MDKRALTPTLVFVVVSLFACAHTNITDTETRNATTGIASGERIAIVLGARNDLAPSEADENSFESCLVDAMRAEEPKLAIIPTEEFRRSAFPGISFQDSPRSSGALLPLLTDAEHRERMSSLKLRYLVILEVSTKSTNLHWAYSGREGREDTDLHVGKEWEKFSHLTAQVLDLTEARQAGELIVGASGKAAVGVGVLIMIPVPFYFSAPTESRACASLGRATARFIMEKGS